MLGPVPLRPASCIWEIGDLPKRVNADDAMAEKKKSTAQELRDGNHMEPLITLQPTERQQGNGLTPFGAELSFHHLDKNGQHLGFPPLSPSFFHMLLIFSGFSISFPIIFYIFPDFPAHFSSINYPVPTPVHK